MDAMIYKEYGNPNVLRHVKHPIPKPSAREVLVKIRGIGLNPIDCEIRKGRMKIVTGSKFPRIPGSDFSGEVVGMGSRVTGFEIGDNVYGMSKPEHGGAYASYIAIPASEIGPKPEILTFTEAASVPLAGLTALQALIRLGNLQPGKRVLVNGASGGVGVFGTQLAKIFGAEVTAVCSFRNTTWVKGLGADRVIDYTKTDFIEEGENYDIIFDAYGNKSYPKVKKILHKEGRYISTIPNTRNFKHAFFTRWAKTKAKVVLVKANTEDLTILKRLIDDEKIQIVIDKTFPVKEAANAMRYLETRRAKGKLIMTPF